MTIEIAPVIAGVMAQLAMLMWRTNEKFMALLDGIVAVLLFVAWFIGLLS